VTLLDAIGLALAAIHFGVPATYYIYLKKVWLNKAWNLKMDKNFTPKVSIIIPTYMGAKWIAQRLDNIYDQDYPRDKIEIIVVDSNSPDGTGKIVSQWAENHKDVVTKLVVEPRRGKLAAVLKGLNHVSPDSELVVLTDDDCLWEKSALKNVVKYFADPTVGAVTSSIKYLGTDGTDNVYRDFYNQVRIAESKWWSTPVHNGPLLAIRKSIVEKIGLPNFPGADDSAFASYIAFAGFRAVQVDDVWTYEPTTERQHSRMIRRAIHLVTYFTKLKRYAKSRGIYTKTKFDKIWNIEAYLHTYNPILFTIAVILLATSALMGSTLALLILIAGTALLAIKPYRTWVRSQLYLLVAIPKTLVTRKETWDR